jgi:hypothetical protein
VVDHVGHVVDVDAARGDIGRDEHVLLPALNAAIERSRPPGSCHRAPAAALNPRSLSFVDQRWARPLGAREDDGLAAAIGLQASGR